MKLANTIQLARCRCPPIHSMWEWEQRQVGEPFIPWLKTGGFLAPLCKLAKAEWLRDDFRQASEAAVIVWFAVPACLALGGLLAPEPFWWHRALSQVNLAFDAAHCYADTLLATSWEERKAAACVLGQLTMDALDPLFRNTAY